MNNGRKEETGTLIKWGWTPEWENRFATAISAFKAPDKSNLKYAPARILAEQRDYFQVVSPMGLHRAESKGRLRKKSLIQPSVGDWVVINENLLIESVLSRMTCLRRKAAGESEQVQIMACNIDWVFVATSLNQDFNLRRLERFFVAALDSGAETALVLTKSDLQTHAESLIEIRQAVTSRFGEEIEILFTSAKTEMGIAELRALLTPGKTGVFLGTSGVGKSSLVNSLLARPAQTTSEIREDDSKGRHTTTGRQSYLLPDGGIIIDSPGIRELQLADEEIRVEDEFSDIEELSLKCKFSNCLHLNEKGCAVGAAIIQGDLAVDRLASYRKLKAEILVQSKKKYR